MCRKNRSDRPRGFDEELPISTHTMILFVFLVEVVRTIDSLFVRQLNKTLTICRGQASILHVKKPRIDQVLKAWEERSWHQRTAKFPLLHEAQTSHNPSRGIGIKWLSNAQVMLNAIIKSKHFKSVYTQPTGFTYNLFVRIDDFIFE